MNHRQFDFFEHNALKLYYAKEGSGDKILFCFHGFGLDHTIFYPLSELYHKQYTIYNFDIPFHGKSTWQNADKPIDPNEWKDYIESFCVQQSITRFSLLSYSIGSNFTWACLQLLPSYIEKIIVIAPDGIIKNNWYHYSTRTAIARFFFKRIMQNKSFLNSFFTKEKNLRIIHRSAGKFAWNQLQTKTQREQVYYTWVVLRKLKFTAQQLSSQANEHNISICFYFGKHDQIISYKKMDFFVAQINHKKIHLLNCGHTNIIEAVLKHVRENVT